MVFEVAIYTDVLASEAIDSIGGFNFQAVSPGISGTDRQRIRESLLHRVVPSWSLSHDELSHPPTCAYVVADGRAYLARGKSTGKTNSGRPGNQVTQAIVTSDPDDFVPYRPAQLYGALEWSLEKALGSRLDPWVTPLEIRPEFEVASLQEYVRDDEWAVAVLPQFLTMLDEVLAAEPKKLVLLHTDLDVVMRWIALGTLFVDAEAARAVHFRALVDDLRRVDALIIGMSPEFGVGDLGAANVLDLTRRSVPTIVASDIARVRADWFLEHGADDALNASVIARRWEPVFGRVLATEAARLVGLPDDASEGRAAWRTSMAAIDRLASAGLRDDLAMYAEELCEGTLSYGPTSEKEFRLAGTAIRRAHDLGVDEVAARVALSTLEALVAVPAASRGFTQELARAKGPISWESADAQEAGGRFLGELLAAASAATLPDLFAAAYVVGLVVPDAQLRPAVASLAALWLRDPALGRNRWQRWLAGDAVVSATARQVVNAWRVGDEQALTSLLRGDWDFLGSVVDDPTLAGWLKAGQLGRISPEERTDSIAQTAVLPSSAWRIALTGSTLPTHAGLWASWIVHNGLPDDLAAVVRSSLRSALDADPAGADAFEAGDWSPLMRSLGAAGDTWLAQISGSYTQAQAVLKKARDNVRARSGASLDGCLPAVKGLAPLLLADIGLLLLRSTNSAAVERVLNEIEPWGLESVRASILGLARSGDGLRAIERALRARDHPHKEIVVAAEDALDRIIESQPDLADSARVPRWLRDGLEDYLFQRDRSHGTRRWLGRPFGRGKRVEN
ncbi:hypothetical protein [Frankia sp. QA3]|uniref:GAP1-N2 domain-containing protein n=1 Tax=Frankia sp. QA3 TaxID=710111 RepID=UPI000269C940|nr:hypothetical protein [Frankia sp. QA3]EIV94662.1 hypothetical protein FraQA3DRAFT_4438 [Frankia sp. QA3]